MTPALRLVSVSAVVSLLAVGCGGGDDKGSSSTKDTAPTKASAEAAAKAILLTTADLPGYENEASDPSDGEDDPTDKAIADCLGFTQVPDVADISSDDFSKGEPPSGVQIGSEVVVVASIAKAKEELAAYEGDKAAGCIEKILGADLKKEVSQDGVTVAEPKVTKKTSPVSGTDGAFSFELTTTVSGAAASIPITFTFDGFLVKHTEVTLFTAGFGQTVSPAERKDLLGKLVTRAKDKAV